ncbi:hypothetical protein B0T16DRAFT_455140 [Cercophora newfieldiana]|uniref:Uncharacterized protein n=1 Tax=Cercophora newfieldiana TaxID=92897 RepID=A0AA40CXF6_9PEZI|nr:hypothetical protein B0T16DRAFT_455140 [Cercophora newfieldiana]
MWVRDNVWIKLSGPGAKFVVTPNSIFGISPDRKAAYKWNNNGVNWETIRTDTAGGGSNSVFAISPNGRDISRWTPDRKWEKISSLGREFAVDGKGHVYGISRNGKVVDKWSVIGQPWTEIGGIYSEFTHIYAGGLGVFAQTKDKLFCYFGEGESW